MRQKPGDLDQMLFAYRQSICGAQWVNMFKPHFFQKGQCLPGQSAACRNHWHAFTGQKYILGDAHRRDQAKFLLGDGDARFFGLCWCGETQCFAVHLVVASEAVIETADDFHHRRLAGAIFANQPHNFAGCDFKTCTTQGLDCTIASVDVRKFQKRLHEISRRAGVSVAYRASS